MNPLYGADVLISLLRRLVLQSSDFCMKLVGVGDYLVCFRFPSFCVLLLAHGLMNPHLMDPVESYH